MVRVNGREAPVLARLEPGAEKGNPWWFAHGIPRPPSMVPWMGPPHEVLCFHGAGDVALCWAQVARKLLRDQRLGGRRTRGYRISLGVTVPLCVDQHW